MNNLINPIFYVNQNLKVIDSTLFKLDLKDLRLKNHLTQKRLAELSGLSEKCIQNIESNNGNPTFLSINKYLEVLGYKIDIVKNDYY